MCIHSYMIRSVLPTSTRVDEHCYCEHQAQPVIESLAKIIDDGGHCGVVASDGSVNDTTQDVLASGQMLALCHSPLPGAHDCQWLTDTCPIVTFAISRTRAPQGHAVNSHHAK